MESGCFVKYDKYTIFLTVYHTVNNNKLVNAIVVDFDEANGVQLLPLAEIDPIIRSNIMTKEIEEVDFAIKILDSMPPCHLFDVGQDGIIKFKKKRIQLVSTLTDLPLKSEEYGFAGYIWKYNGQCYGWSKISICIKPTTCLL